MQIDLTAQECRIIAAALQAQVSRMVALCTDTAGPGDVCDRLEPPIASRHRLAMRLLEHARALDRRLSTVAQIAGAAGA